MRFLKDRLRDLAEGRYELQVGARHFGQGFARDCGRGLPPSASHEKSLLQDLVISKTLRSYYKLPHQIAHSVLARRMYDRDPGSAPQVRTGHWVSYACASRCLGRGFQRGAAPLGESEGARPLR